jgi:hypothetical protein
MRWAALLPLGSALLLVALALRRPGNGRITEDRALARVIRSEIGSGTAQQRLHVAWATRNLAAERRTSIARMACSPCGRQRAGRPVSTRQPARPEDVELARLVLAAHPALDPTGGATHFINPRLQDRLALSGKVPGYAGQTYTRVRRRWQKVYGWEPYYRLGPELELWGPRRRRSREALFVRGELPGGRGAERQRK